MVTPGPRSGTPPAPAPRHRTPWLRIAAGSVVAGIAFIVLAVLLRDGAGESLLVLGMLALIVAWFAAALGWVPGRGRRFGFLPSTGLGRQSLAVMVVGWLMAWLPGKVQGKEPEVYRLLEVVVWGGFAAMFVAGLLVLVAMGRRGERSLPVILLGAFAALFGPFFVLGELVAG